MRPQTISATAPPARRILSACLIMLAAMNHTAAQDAGQTTGPQSRPAIAARTLPAPVVEVDNADRRESTLVVVVQGTSGTPEYGRLFGQWTDRWLAAARRGHTTAVRIGPADATASAGPRNSSPEDGSGGSASDRQKLRAAIARFATQAARHADSELWIVLIGHGTFDGRTARFNLQGPDVSDRDLARWLEPVRSRTAVVNCASSSGPFLKTLARPGRIVITATKSGAEQNFSRFGDYLSQAIGDAAFDLDKDGQTSLFEAFLSASRRTAQFYEAQGRLATEHALLDDTGDGQGTRADFFRGIRPVRQTADGTSIDGRAAHQWHLIRSAAEQSLPPEVRAERDRIEQQVLALRDRKGQFSSEDTYYAELEPLLIRLAEICDTADSAPAEIGTPAGTADPTDTAAPAPETDTAGL